MAYLDEKSGKIMMSEEERKQLTQPQTPYFVKHLWDWILTDRTKKDKDITKDHDHQSSKE